jgi:hypothetical protein
MNRFVPMIVAGLALIAAGGAQAAAGLSGDFYKVTPGSTGFSIAATLAQLQSATLTGTFISTSVNYGGGDGSSIVDFLNSNGHADGASYSGPSGAFDLSDGILDLKGFIYVNAGSAVFDLSHDDAAQLTVGGYTVSGGCCGTGSVTATFASAGYVPIEVIYANTIYSGGVGGAHLVLTENGNLVTSAQTISVPEPATWALLIMGFGGAGAALRRRRAAVA